MNTKMTPTYDKLMDLASETTLDNLEEAYSIIRENIPTPLLNMSNGLANKDISVLLSSYLNDITYYYNEPKYTIFIDKYITDNTAPLIKHKPVKLTTDLRFTTIRQEMLLLMQRLGVVDTIKMYALVIHHLGA